MNQRGKTAELCTNVHNTAAHLTWHENRVNTICEELRLAKEAREEAAQDYYEATRALYRHANTVLGK